ncbi:hypothetical protein [Marinobacter sp. NP-4(2019)]|uniref:hypothetical protein n=1 Tax=Marinobacter sp. NP-4(2019) TaxID=2488665 RepID=UPI0013DEB2C4|nr:hypothetical protein [Marinobacter sp. NP-4(2019)]
MAELKRTRMYLQRVSERGSCLTGLAPMPMRHMDVLERVSEIHTRLTGLPPKLKASHSA